jgi:hypothetical protein
MITLLLLSYYEVLTGRWQKNYPGDSYGHAPTQTLRLKLYLYIPSPRAQAPTPTQDDLQDVI